MSKNQKKKKTNSNNQFDRNLLQIKRTRNRTESFIASLIHVKKIHSTSILQESLSARITVNIHLPLFLSVQLNTDKMTKHYLIDINENSSRIAYKIAVGNLVCSSNILFASHISKGVHVYVHPLATMPLSSLATRLIFTFPVA